MVEVVLTDGKIDEVDCCYGSCVYQSSCRIAEAIDALREQ